MIPLKLVHIFARLQAPGTRQAALADMAEYAGAHQVLVFGKDVEIGKFLPAQGCQQTLPHARKWQAFLDQCIGTGTHAGTVPSPVDGSDCVAFGIGDGTGLSAMVLLGERPSDEAIKGMAALMPMLGSTLSMERAALAAAGHAVVAQEASRRANALNAALDANRRELQKAFERGERELESRREAERRLREADRRKDDFLAMLAHELRNPLAPISMAAQILSFPNIGPAQTKQAREIIERQIGHMTNLLDDLLDVSRVTRGLIVLEKRPHTLQSLIADAVEQVRPVIEARRHRLNVGHAEAPATVLGDRTRLVQVITNLLHNAAKYTPDGGDILVQADVDAEMVSLTVQDTGIGIDAGLMPHLFEIFTQGDRTSDRSQGGLGLGLALVKSLTELHGGRVTCHSEGRGKGSRFTVCLPRAVEKDGAAEIPSASSHLLSLKKSLRILVVEDNVDAARMLQMFLESAGYAVRVEHQPGEALEEAIRDAPDVAILDIGLPGMDGRELSRLMRSRPETADTVLIAVTGYGQVEERALAIEAGFHHYLVKPVDPHALIALLERMNASSTVRG
ncbi:MAG: Signal transduction histidine kinase [Herminiimonas sp.]|nr:Signal transduction histidine kinase [Herminiimonas sp.]